MIFFSRSVEIFQVYFKDMNFKIIENTEDKGKWAYYTG